jgi:hypothetical protein
MKSKAEIYNKEELYKDFISWRTDELDLFLKREFRIGLYSFAFLLFEVIEEPIKKKRTDTKIHDGWVFPEWHPYENRPLNREELLLKYKPRTRRLKELGDLNRAGLYPEDGPEMDRETLRLLKQKIVTLRKKILELAGEIEVRRKYIVDTPPKGKSPEDQRALAARWRVDEFLSRLQDEYVDLISMRPTVGRPSNPKTEAACLWAQHFRHMEKRVPWPLIAALMDWFMDRLQRYAFYQKIFTNKEMSDPDHLRQKFYKHKKRWELLYAYRCGGRMYRDFQEAGLNDEEIKKARLVLIFGRTYDEFRDILRRPSYAEFQFNGFTGRMLAATRHVLICTDSSRNALILPDGSFILA